jgi:hypothetical protein
MCELLREKELAENAEEGVSAPGASFYGGVNGALNLRQEWGMASEGGGTKNALLALLLLLLPVAAFVHFRRRRYDAVDDEDKAGAMGSRRRHDGRVGLPTDAEGEDEDARTKASGGAGLDGLRGAAVGARAVDQDSSTDNAIELSAVPSISPNAMVLQI